jgi:hypothetical protein
METPDVARTKTGAGTAYPLLFVTRSKPDPSYPLNRVYPIRLFLVALLCFICVACDSEAGEGGVMRIQFSMEGGIAYFPGLSQPVTIDSEQLSHQESDELRRLIDAADFFNLPPNVGKPARGAADYRQYTATIQEGQRQHTVHVMEPIEDANLRRLIEFLNLKANEIRRAVPKSSSD